MFVALNEKDCFFFSFSFLWKLTGCVTSSYFSQTVWMRTGAVDEVILHINHAAEIQSATLHLRLIQIHAAVHHVYSFSALKLTLQLHVWVRWKTLQHNLLSRSLNYYFDFKVSMNCQEEVEKIDIWGKVEMLRNTRIVLRVN